MNLINVVIIALPFLASLTGCYRIKYLTAVQKVFLIQVLVAFFTETTGYALTHREQKNIFLYNIYFLIDISLLLWAAILMASPETKRFFSTALLFFIVVWSYTIYTTGINIFSNWSFLFGCILLTTSYMYLIIHKWQQTDSPFFDDKHFCIQLGTAIYFGVNIPYFCVINYLNKYDGKLSLMLFTINIVLLSIRYIFTSVNFYKSKRIAQM